LLRRNGFAMLDAVMDSSLLLSHLSADRSVSGSALADRLGVTRAAVWKQIEALRALGAPIEAAAGSGYRLGWPLELLDAAKIRAELSQEQRRRIGKPTIHWQIDSTNTELMRLAGEGARDLETCLAETQSAGRGRRGRAWVSPLGGNIYCSLLKRFDQGMGALAGLSLAIGVAVIEALEDCDVRNVALKWPNDVVVGGRKLAGILIELGGEFLGPCHAVIGIGINLRLSSEVLDAIDQPAIDIASIFGAQMPKRNAIAGRLLARLIETLDRFCTLGIAGFADAYARCDSLRGKAVRVQTPSGIRDGIAVGIDDRGALRVRHDDAIVIYESADVSVRAR
jgi:BirA family transcriptional regulator, biotin operon repressor / biotin---[acetyl-CoA-carboxylase] ligase